MFLLSFERLQANKTKIIVAQISNIDIRIYINITKALEVYVLNIYLIMSLYTYLVDENDNECSTDYAE